MISKKLRLSEDSQVLWSVVRYFLRVYCCLSGDKVSNAFVWFGFHPFNNFMDFGIAFRTLSVHKFNIFLITSRIISTRGPFECDSRFERWNTFGDGLQKKTKKKTFLMWIIFLVNVTRFLFHDSLVHIFTWIYFELFLCVQEKKNSKKKEEKDFFSFPSAKVFTSFMWFFSFPFVCFIRKTTWKSLKDISL